MEHFGTPETGRDRAAGRCRRAATLSAETSWSSNQGSDEGSWTQKFKTRMRGRHRDQCHGHEMVKERLWTRALKITNKAVDRPSGACLHQDALLGTCRGGLQNAMED
jgi:hypothetical protein